MFIKLSTTQRRLQSRVAYNTVWYCGIICKLLHFLLDRHMISLIMKPIRNQILTLTTDTGKQIRLRRLKNGVSQGIVLAPLVVVVVVVCYPFTTPDC